MQARPRTRCAEADSAIWQSLTPIRTLLLAIFLLMAGNGSLATLAAVRLQADGASPALIEAVATACFAGLTLGSLTVFRVVARVGHIRAFAAFASLLSAMALVYAAYTNALLWMFVRLVEGWCLAGVFVCLESWLADRTTPETRGGILGAYMIALYAGQALGQYLLTMGRAAPALPFIVASVLLSLSVLPVALTRAAAPALPDIKATRIGQLYATSPLGMAGVVTSGLILGAFYGLGPVVAREVGYDDAGTALFMSVVICGGVLLQWSLGRLSDAIDRRKVIVSVLALTTAVSAAMLLLVDRAGARLMGAGGLFGGMAFALYPLCVAHTNDHLKAHDRVGASAGLVLAYSVGAALGPLGAAPAVANSGPAGLFLFIAGTAAATLGFSAWRRLARSGSTRAAAPISGAAAHDAGGGAARSAHRKRQGAVISLVQH